MASGTTWFEDPSDYAWRYGNDTRAGSWHSTSPIVPEPPRANPTSIIGLTPGYTPNYRELILSDPSYLEYQNGALLNEQQAAARRREALRQLVVRYGGIGGLKDAYGDVDQNTLDRAARNEFSDTKRIERNYNLGVEAYKKALAARRGLSSGELQFGLDQADYARGASEYDLGQEFSNAAQMAVNDYVGVVNANARSRSAALSAAEQNVYSNPYNRPTEGTQANLDPDWQTKYGVPVYVGPNGSLWTVGADGNPTAYTPPAPAAVGSYEPAIPKYFSGGSWTPL